MSKGPRTAVLLALGAVLLAGCRSATPAQAPATGTRPVTRAAATTPATSRPTTPATTHATPPSAPHPSTDAALPATRLRTFVPFRADGSPAVTTTRTSTGRCWTTSIAAPVRGAYRCFAANQILDPCFVAGAHAATAICVLNPWAPAQLLRLNAALPAGASILDVTRPWALELANGARCVAVTGTAPSVAGVSLAYSCGGDHGAALVTARGEIMTAHYAKAGASALQTVRVAVAWHA